MKDHWKNGKTSLFYSEQFTLIAWDPLSHQVMRNLHCLDVFFRFLTVYPVMTNGAQATISVVEKCKHSFVIPQSIVHDRGTAFINNELSPGQKKWESCCHLEQHTRPGLMAKLKPRISTTRNLGGTS